MSPVRAAAPDELQLWLVRVVAGSGARLFAESSSLFKLKLTDARSFSSGAVKLTYAATHEGH